MSRFSPASLGCGAFLAYLAALLVALVAGFWGAWVFTAYTAVPWMEVPGEWSKLTAVLLTFFVTGPFCASIVLIVEVIIGFLGLGAIALFAGRRYQATD
jgi:hypothetical protein